MKGFKYVAVSWRIPRKRTWWCTSMQCSCFNWWCWDYQKCIPEDAPVRSLTLFFPWSYCSIWVQLNHQILSFMSMVSQRHEFMPMISQLSCKFLRSNIWISCWTFEDLTWMSLEVQFTRRAALQKLVWNIALFVHSHAIFSIWYSKRWISI
mgnify:CR=1 FL=1